jgi:hypothetical protein
MLCSCPIGSTALGFVGFRYEDPEIASSRVSAAFPDLTPPSRSNRGRGWSQWSKSTGHQRDPNDLCSRAGRSNPLLPRARRNRAPHVADLVMRDGDKETPSHPRFDGCREEGVEPPFDERAVCTLARCYPGLDAPDPLSEALRFPRLLTRPPGAAACSRRRVTGHSARASPRRLALGLCPRCFPSMRPLTGRPLFSTACPQTVEESPVRSFLNE